MEFDIVELKEGYDFAEKNDALFCQTSSKEGAPEFSLFIRKLVEKFILKKQLKQIMAIILLKYGIQPDKKDFVV